MRDGGRIINISSAATRIAYPESVVYSMSKGAMNTFTLALAKELGGRGITVNAVEPGFVETEMNTARRATPEQAAESASWSVFDRLGSAVGYRRRRGLPSLRRFSVGHRAVHRRFGRVQNLSCRHCGACPTVRCGRAPQ